MRFFTFVFLYGMLSLSGLFLSVFWGIVTARRVKQIADRGLRHDRYFWLAFSLALNSIGSVVLFGTRAGSNIRFGLSQMLYGIDGLLIATGLIVVLLAKVMMVWLADLERPKPRWLWTMGATTLVWTLICLGLSV